MASVTLTGFKNYEEALAFAEWFGYADNEVFTPESNFSVEASIATARIETDNVDVSVVTHDIEIPLAKFGNTSIFDEDF
mgnify:FL=1